MPKQTEQATLKDNVLKPEDQVLSKRNQEVEKMFLSHGLEPSFIVFTIVTAFILYFGWTSNLDYYITAESGAGYFLGIIGSTMMLCTLLYSLRKRLKSMSKWGKLRNWFTVHMVLGIYGPVLTLYHCNFSLGSSQNEKVAVISMLVVVVSGIVGRYVHDKIRYGIYRHEAALEQLQLEKLMTEKELASLQQENPVLFKEILTHNNNIQVDKSGLFNCFFRMLSLNTITRAANIITHKQLKKACQQLAKKEQWSPEKHQQTIDSANHFLSAHFLSIRKIASYSFYERIFSIWFFLHIPLFYMMIVSVIFHIIAVHMFSVHSF